MKKIQSILKLSISTLSDDRQDDQWNQIEHQNQNFIDRHCSIMYRIKSWIVQLEPAPMQTFHPALGIDKHKKPNQ